jgi:hypothetical protein
MEAKLAHVLEQSAKPAYSRRITLFFNILGPVCLILGLVVGAYTLYLASYAANGYGPQFILKDGNTGVAYVAPPSPVVLATASTTAAIQNYTLRVGQKSCQTETTCIAPQMVLPDPLLMQVGTIVTVRNGSVDTESTTNNSSSVSYISPPQKVSVKIGGTGTDYVVRGDMKSFIVLDIGSGPQWFHAGLPLEGWQGSATIVPPT